VTRSIILDLIESVGLSRHADDIQGFVKTTINLQPIPPKRGQVDVGRSKLGGLPDLPSSMEWPVWKNQPLSFIGQFRMTEAAPHDSDGALPHTGFLYFFYEANEQVWGYDPAHRGAWRVLHYDGPESELCRRLKPGIHPAGTVPEDEFQECVLEFSQGV
jgi:uncharacterized protein YwqG